MTAIPVSLYVHLPWCVQKCPYCDFNSHALREALPEDVYIQALILDLKEEAKRAMGRPLKSIFFGGGTPSLFSAAGIEKILIAIHQEFPYSKDLEITLEANPGTIDQQRFADYRKVGVNRISLGVQSFNPQHLKQLGRIHDDKAAHRGIEAIQQAGFDNFNVDLMHGLPNQTIEEGLEDLRIGLSYQPTHLSWYQLTLEPNTVFYKKPPALPDEDFIAVLQKHGRNQLAQAGYQHYEVSAYSQPGRECQHNLNYWQFGDYLGIGAGAHGKLTDSLTKTITRRAKTRHPKDYLDLQKSFVATETIILKKDHAFEFMLNALRLQSAISWDLFENRTQCTRQDLEKKLKELQQLELLDEFEKFLQLSEKGRLFLDDVVARFL